VYILIIINIYIAGNMFRF